MFLVLATAGAVGWTGAVAADAADALLAPESHVAGGT
jgi:hypothetical protein